MPIKTTERERESTSHLIGWLLSKQSKQKQAEDSKHGVKCGESGALYTVGRKAKWSNLCGKQCRGSSKHKKVKLPYNPTSPHLAIYLKELKLERPQHSDVHCGTNHNSQDVGTM